MAQALIQPAVPNVQVAVTAPLVDPAAIREERRRYLRDDIPELDHANAFYCPTGRWACRGWILVQQANYAKINIYATDLQLQIDDFISGTLTLKNLAIVQARCVSTGIASDPTAIYLVELTDAQGVLSNPWAQWLTTSMYNVLAPAYPGQYYDLSTNAGTPWTWSTMVGDLWGQMPLLGAYPGLPSAPSGTPENFNFVGVPCWDALNRVLDLVGMTITCDLTKASPYSIVSVGAADAVFAALQVKYAGRIQDDLAYIDGGSGRIPGSVTVLFHRINEYYGTEETVRMDGLQWQTGSFFSVNVVGPAPYNASAGEGFLWDSFAVRFDINGNPLAADVVTATAIANERVTQYYAREFRGTQGYRKQVYAGALPFYAGSMVDGVCWRQTRKQRQGWVTEIVTGPQPPFPQVDRRWT